MNLIADLLYRYKMRIRNVGMVSTWLLAGLIGCGSVKTTADPDAATETPDPDATVTDASVPDAQANGTVTVKVMIAGNPAEGIPVFYHEVDGSYIGSVLTNSSGEVTIDDFPAGGAVTAPVDPFVDGFNSDNQLTSITGVQIGDELTLGNSVIISGQTGQTVGNASIRAPNTTVANATRYRVYIPCRSRSNTMLGATYSLTMREGCINPNNTIDAIAVAEDANGVRLAYSTRTGIPVTGVAPNLTASALMSGWNTDWASLRVNLTNAPFDGIEPEGLFQGHREGLILDDEEFNDLNQVLNMGDQGFFQRKSVPNFTNDAAYILAISASPMGGTESISILSTREQLSFNPGSNLVRNVDLTTDISPNLQNIVVEESGSDLSISWSTEGNAVGCKDNPMPDSLVTVVRGEAGNNDYIWFVLSEGSSSQSLSFPVLDPAVAQSFWPISTFTEVTGGVAVFSDSAKNWDEIRSSENNMSYFDYIPTPDSTRCVATGGALNFN